MNENYAVIQRECGEYGSVKDTHANTPIKVVNYKFTMLLFFREMSDKQTPIPMEVEEGGIEAYMVDFRGMLDGLDNPSEVSGVGVGTCAGDILIEREANAMCRDGGLKMAKLSPYLCQFLPVLNPGLMMRVLKGVQVVGSMVQKFVHFFGTVMDMPKPTLGPSIPCGVSFSRWVEAHRESCGFEDLKPSGSSKRSQPPMSYQKKAKR